MSGVRPLHLQCRDGTYHLRVRVPHDVRELVGAPTDAELLGLLASNGVSLREISYGRSHDGAIFWFNGNVQASTARAFGDLAAQLRTLPGLTEFELSRIGNKAEATKRLLRHCHGNGLDLAGGAIQPRGQPDFVGVLALQTLANLSNNALFGCLDSAVAMSIAQQRA